MDCHECGGRTGGIRTVCVSCAKEEANRAEEVFRLHLLRCHDCIRAVVFVVLGASAPRSIDNMLTCTEGRVLQRDARDWRLVAGIIRRSN